MWKGEGRERDTHPPTAHCQLCVLPPFHLPLLFSTRRDTLYEHYELKLRQNNKTNNNKNLRHMPKWLSRRRNVGETFRATYLNDFA